MVDVVVVLGLVLLAYLFGSLPAGYLLARLWGVDVLAHGSGRTGGTNVLRAAGPLPAFLTGAVDVGKGALAVWVAGLLAPDAHQALAQVLAGAAVILGHNHSVFLDFRGGAGVGTSLGALSVIHFPLAGALVIVLLLVIAITRYASVGSLVVIVTMPIVLLILAVTGTLSMTYVFYGLLACLIIGYSHRPNIRRLLEGTERRLGKSGQSSPQTSQ
jgi:glycerol-3-phosphate acyltransferase PlsY